MYRLYFDEVGNDGLKNLEKEQNQFLSLTGIAMRVNCARDVLEPALNKIKADIFNHDPDFPVIMHRKEIMGGKGLFRPIREDSAMRALYNAEILKILEECDYSVITVLIDKAWMMRQDHWLEKHPYHYLTKVMVEKYAQFLERKQSIGDIMPESRQGKDLLLQKAYDRVLQEGTDYVSADRLASVLRGKKLKFRKKDANSAGLQLCDMIAYPSHKHTRYEMGHEIELGPFASIIRGILVDHKYDRSYRGIVREYGYKGMPNTKRAA